MESSKPGDRKTLLQSCPFLNLWLNDNHFSEETNSYLETISQKYDQEMKNKFGENWLLQHVSPLIYMGTALGVFNFSQVENSRNDYLRKIYYVRDLLYIGYELNHQKNIPSFVDDIIDSSMLKGLLNFNTISNDDRRNEVKKYLDGVISVGIYMRHADMSPMHTPVRAVFPEKNLFKSFISGLNSLDEI